MMILADDVWAAKRQTVKKAITFADRCVESMSQSLAYAFNDCSSGSDDGAQVWMLFVNVEVTLMSPGR